MFWTILQNVCRSSLSRPPRRRGTRSARAAFHGEYLESRCLLAVISMTDQEQLLLELVNRARANPIAEAERFGIDLNQGLEPGEISPDPTQPLAPNQMLITAARRHSDDMLVREFFEHVNPDGEGPTDRAHAAGYPGNAGENIAWYGLAGVLQRDAEVTRRHEALFLSPHHRSNMLYRGYRELGNGIRFGEFSLTNAIMVSEEFGNQGGDFFITGVAYTDAKVPDSFYTIGESLGGLEVTARRNRDGVTFSAETGPSGGYALQVPAGIYTVTARGTGLSKPITVENVTMLGGNSKVDFNSRSSGLGEITGVLFQDDDQDGVHDSGEPSLAQRQVYIDADDDGEHDSDETIVQTNSSGTYHFANLRAGEYVLRQQLPPGWQSTGASSDPLTVQLAAGQFSLGADMGSVVVNEVPVTRPDVYTGRAGQPLSMDVFANDEDFDGNLVLTLTQIRTPPAHGNVALNRTTGKLVFTPEDGFSGTDSFEYAVVDDGGLASLPARVTITITPDVGTSWQNPVNVLDVNGDTFVSSIDALLVLNVINREGAGPLEFPTDGNKPPPFLDVTGDGFVSPLDALLVVNEVNRIAAERRNATAGEGEPPVEVRIDSPTASRIDLVAAAVDALFELDEAKISRQMGASSIQRAGETLEPGYDA